MTVIKTSALSPETSLVGRIVNQQLSATGLILYVSFVDKKTGEAREPQSTTRLFTLDVDYDKFEMIYGTHTTAAGITTITIDANGRNLNKYGYLNGTTEGFLHGLNAEVGCVDVHLYAEVLGAILRGEQPTMKTLIKVGDETDSNIFLYFENGDANTPYLKYDATTSSLVFANDGVTELPVGGGTGSITAGDGISILAGVVAAAGAIQISSGDTNANYLIDKLVAGTGITLTKNNAGADETITIEADLLQGAIDDHEVYTPAYLTGGSSATSNYLLYTATSDGEFSITIDGVAHDITGLDFTTTTDMGDVASIIQAGIRSITSGTETCVWSTDHFIITSGITTSSSAITVTSAVGGGAGTDISGVTAADPQIDADTGNGTVTAAVLNISADAGKIVKTNSAGNIDKNLTADYTAKGGLLIGTAANTSDELTGITDGQMLIKDSAETTGWKGGNVEYYELAKDDFEATNTTYHLKFDITPTITSGLTAVSVGTGALTLNSLNVSASTSSINSTVRCTTTGVINVANTDFKLLFAGSGSAAAGNSFWGVCAGFSTIPSSTLTSAHAGFLRIGSTLYASVANGATQTLEAIGGVTVTDFAKYRIEFNAGSNAEFYIDNVLVKTITTNLPTTGLASLMLLFDSQASSGSYSWTYLNKVIFNTQVY